MLKHYFVLRKYDFVSKKNISFHSKVRMARSKLIELLMNGKVIVKFPDGIL